MFVMRTPCGFTFSLSCTIPDTTFFIALELMERKPLKCKIALVLLFLLLATYLFGCLFVCLFMLIWGCSNRVLSPLPLSPYCACLWLYLCFALPCLIATWLYPFYHCRLIAHVCGFNPFYTLTLSFPATPHISCHHFP